MPKTAISCHREVNTYAGSQTLDEPRSFLNTLRIMTREARTAFNPAPEETFKLTGSEAGFMRSGLETSLRNLAVLRQAQTQLKSGKAVTGFITEDDLVLANVVVTQNGEERYQLQIPLPDSDGPSSPDNNRLLVERLTAIENETRSHFSVFRVAQKAYAAGSDSNHDKRPVFGCTQRPCRISQAIRQTIWRASRFPHRRSVFQ